MMGRAELAPNAAVSELQLGAVKGEALIRTFEDVGGGIFRRERVTGLGDLAQKGEPLHDAGEARVVGVEQPGLARVASELTLQIGEHAAKDTCIEGMEHEDDERAFGRGDGGGVVLEDGDAFGPFGADGDVLLSGPAEFGGELDAKEPAKRELGGDEQG